ncbi:hypothetical protein ACEWY4_001262 [Coilia grayii]|uniref:RNase H type-1 domain-containing protein n=1 Tax=Coilia grayii TaxID=363190 RepID=A0ABD1KYZ5_9TELE
MSFLGLTNYCRSWIPNYAELTAPLQSLMYKEDLKMSDKLKWTPVEEKALCDIKQAMVNSSTLALPDYQKEFVQMVDCRGHFMTSVLTQTHGGKLKPVAYYSTKMDAVACALPHCVQAVIAASLAVTASADIVLFHPLVLKVPHAVSALLLQTKMSFLSPARHLSCMSILLSQPHLTIERCTILNPATLVPTEDEGETHDCEALAEQTAKSRADLKDIPLTKGHVLFVDGSSKKDELGKTKTGYAVVTHDKVLKAGALPQHYSAQAAELVALTEACKLMKGKIVTIYTDSQYAYAATHTFAQHWKNRGMITSTGKPVTHAKLLTELLQAVQLPQQLAICKCAAHTTGTDPVSKGNAFADKTAKAAAQGQVSLMMSEDLKSWCDDTVLQEMQQQSPKSEQDTWIKKGAILKQGIYV